MSEKLYRTLVRGRLVQESALCVGGSTPEAGGADLPCARDGRDRLTIPGSGLATFSDVLQKSSPRSAATVAAIWLCVTDTSLRTPSGGVSGPSTAIQIRSAPGIFLL